MKTMIREIREELVAVREEMRGRVEKWQVEEADWRKRMEIIEKKMEQREKNERENNVILTGIGGIRGNIKRGCGGWKNG
jgi:fructoselysine-6-P-deglycase FrlB-like protein